MCNTSDISAFWGFTFSNVKLRIREIIKKKPRLALEDHAEIRNVIASVKTALSKSRLFCSSSSFIANYISHNTLLLAAFPSRKRSHNVSWVCFLIKYSAYVSCFIIFPR